MKNIKNFFEVALGFDSESAKKEARRCLQCKDKPCSKGCPVEIDIPYFIKLILEGKNSQALEKIKEKNALPAVCGRVCPQEDQCEAMCVLNKKKIPINIGALERFAADHGLATSHYPLATNSVSNFKVAVVGSGPAGLTCSAELAKMGYAVTLFESLHLPGGVLSYGIPEFRLPKKIVAGEVEYIKSLGVEVKLNILIGNTFSIKDLFDQNYKAIFLGTGAGLPKFLNIEGENFPGVYSANEFLTRVNLMKAYDFPKSATPVKVGKKVVVLGGGNVALDSARCALRLGAEVSIVYRRTEAEMPGRQAEIEHAKEEGIKFIFLTSPKNILSDSNDFVCGLECLKMKLAESDETGRPKPVVIESSEFVLVADTVIVAIGQSPNPLLPKATPELKISKYGTIEINESYETSIAGVFAGGDITTGADTVISAMGAGKKAAKEIDKYLRK